MVNGKMNNSINSYKSFKPFLDKVKNIEGLLVPGQEKLFMVIASKLPKNATVVEIGSFKGKSTACVGIVSPRSTKIYAIDTFEGNNKDFSEGVQFVGGSFLDEFKQNMKMIGIWNKIKLQKGYSSEIAKNWNKPIDFLFIDGSHLYEDVKNDFEMFYPWVKEGGVVAIHDVSSGHPGVLKFWNEKVKHELSVYENVHTLYFGIKDSTKNILTYKLLIKSIKNQATVNKVHIVLPVHNRVKFTLKCLKSITNQSYKNIEVILVNDGSTDETNRLVKKMHPDVKVINGTGNWFWTKSINMGISYALKTAETDDYILTMNNDCFFGKSYIESLVYCSTNRYRSITGSFIIDPAKPDKVLDAGVIIDWKNAHIYGLPERKPYIKDYEDQVDYLSGIDTISGKGTLIPIEVFLKIGMFNQLFLPHYLADYEFFNRAKARGINLVISIKSKLFNFSKETGTEHGNFHHKANYKDVIKVLFDRRSKVNILDHLFFILLRCPKKYLLHNAKLWFLKLLNYILLLFPFYYIKIFMLIGHNMIYGISLFTHRTKIKIKQKFFEK